MHSPSLHPIAGGLRRLLDIILLQKESILRRAESLPQSRVGYTALMLCRSEHEFGLGARAESRTFAARCRNLTDGGFPQSKHHTPVDHTASGPRGPKRRHIFIKMCKNYATCAIQDPRFAPSGKLERSFAVNTGEGFSRIPGYPDHGLARCVSVFPNPATRHGLLISPRLRSAAADARCVLKSNLLQ